MQHVDDKGSSTESIAVVEKWKGQIEKVVLKIYSALTLSM